MIAVNLDRVSFTYISEPIFQNLSWEIHDDQVTGLIGPNGSGKSTLLKLIHGDLNSDTGFTVTTPNLTIGYLPQEPNLNPEHTIWEELLTANQILVEIESELAQIESKLSNPNVYDNEKELGRVLDRQAKLLEDFTNSGGPGYHGYISSVLEKLGFEERDFNLSIKMLSGGQKKLVGLAKLVILRPNLLLLDEPDNHLDLVGKDFLANFIRDYPGAVVIVSHDRYLLDLVVDEIAELEDGKLTLFPGNYSEFAFEKQARLLKQQQLFEAQQKEITRLEQSAKRLLTWGKLYDNNKFIKRGKNILKRIDRIDKIDRPILDRKRMGLELAGWRGSNKVLEMQDLEKIFSQNGDKTDSIIFTGLNATIWHGQRVGLVGPNGAGKSLLFKIILGQDSATGGDIYLGPSVKIGYYAQEHDTLDYNRTLIDTVRYAKPLNESQAVAFLGKFLFTYEHARGPISYLSGGERSRLQMALLMLSGANFLLLDEPTNNIDILSAEILEEALDEFEGTLFVISHDRYFLDRVTDHILEIESGRLNEYIGNFSDFQEQKIKQ
ncbi:MAG: ABC-F family ATP-binding cassette domain-containing protein [Anaerolineales bacterium]